ncbi:MAG TPA: DUF1992 domain-containing protein [Armatimonadota bacterium]|nr:DUF1992 domain-containing protein [Armatimonadota bacterium]
MVQLPEDKGHPIDRIIVDAMQRGEFDHLEGQGKPLRLDLSGNEQTAALRLLKNAGFTPEWVELERAMEQLRDEMSAFLSTYEAQRQQALTALNTLCRQYATAPEAGGWKIFSHLRGSRAHAHLGRRIWDGITAFNAARDRALGEYLRRQHRLNTLTARLNLLHPLRGHQEWNVPVQARAQALCEAYPRLLLAALPAAGKPPEFEWSPGEVAEEWLCPPADAALRTSGQRDPLQVEALIAYRHKRKSGYR